MTPPEPDRYQKKKSPPQTGHADPTSLPDRAPRAPGAPPPQSPEEEHLELPHERDQTAHESTTRKPDAGMHQALKDLQKGQVDTDMRSSPGLDAQQRERYVPGAGGQHPSQSKQANSTPPSTRKGAA